LTLDYDNSNINVIEINGLRNSNVQKWAVYVIANQHIIEFQSNQIMDNIELTEADFFNGKITSIQTVKELWSKTYNTEGKPDWSHILPYYDSNIYFRDSIQEIRGIDNFTALTERLSKRSKDLKMNIVNSAMNDDVIFLEWEMTLSFKKYPSSILYGNSRIRINSDGKIIEQRDYYDLWGDIFDNIPRFGKMYRKFMVKKFG